MKKEIWVLVANSSTAIIYKAEDNHTLKELETLAHPESRLLDRELISSQPGRAFDSMGPGRHAMEQKTSPKTSEFILFARHLSSRLEEALKQGNLKKIYIAANPTFLGILRQNLSHNVAHLIAGEVDKDMTLLKPDQIRKHLPPVL